MFNMNTYLTIILLIVCLAASSTGSKAKKALSAVLSSKKADGADFRNECLDRHNKYRTLHGVSRLTLNSTLNSYAQEWADHLAQTMELKQRSPTKFGENLWGLMSKKSSRKVSGAEIVDSWYQKELPLYNFGTEPTITGLKAGHLTQVLWASSKELGVGFAKNGNFTVVVFNYSPTGNLLGHFIDNVPPIGGFTVSPKSDKTPEVSLNKSPSSTEPSSKPLSKPLEKLLSSKSSPESSPTTVSDEEFVQELLASHNMYRAKHGVPPLSLNSTISKFAKEWADYLSTNGLFKHRLIDNPYGENLHWSSKSCTAESAVTSWYNEIKDYTSYTSEPVKGSAVTGHYTQVVWKATTQVGCGRAVNSKGATVVACNYYPPGNCKGKYVTNVLKPSTS